LPAVPVYGRATHGEAVPYLSSPVSSIAHATGAPASSTCSTGRVELSDGQGR
jgi:hypothetical protein